MHRCLGCVTGTGSSVRKQHFPGEYPKEELLGYELGRKGEIRITLVG